jgi:hypothetical protein
MDIQLILHERALVISERAGTIDKLVGLPMRDLYVAQATYEKYQKARGTISAAACIGVAPFSRTECEAGLHHVRDRHIGGPHLQRLKGGAPGFER